MNDQFIINRFVVQLRQWLVLAKSKTRPSVSLQFFRFDLACTMYLWLYLKPFDFIYQLSIRFVFLIKPAFDSENVTNPSCVYISFYSDDSNLELSILQLASELRSNDVVVELALFNQIEIDREGVSRWCERIYQRCGKMLVIASPKYLEVGTSGFQVANLIFFTDQVIRAWFNKSWFNLKEFRFFEIHFIQTENLNGYPSWICLAKKIFSNLNIMVILCWSSYL